MRNGKKTTHPYEILNLALILINFECLYPARWRKVEWVWGAKLLYRPPTKSTSSFKPLISPDQPEMVKSLWRVIQNLIRVQWLKVFWCNSCFEIRQPIHTLETHFDGSLAKMGSLSSIAFNKRRHDFSKFNFHKVNITHQLGGANLELGGPL